MYKIFYGINTIKNLLNYKHIYIKKIFLCKNKKNKKILELKNLIILKKVFFEIIENFLFKKKFYKLNVVHQGIIAYVSNNIFKKNLSDLYYIIKNNKKKKIFLILDNINSPYNLGSCIRTAVAFGITGIIISKNYSASILNSIVHKVSMGAIYKIFILEVNNLNNIVSFFKKNNIIILGTCLKSKNFLHNYSFNKLKSFALILGSEKSGIKKSLKKKCDILFNISIKNINSLNVSVAYGIIMFDFFYKKLLN